MKKAMKDLQKYNKFIVALVGAVLTIVAQQYGDNEWVTAILPLFTALGVYQAKNAPMKSKSSK